MNFLVETRGEFEQIARACRFRAEANLETTNLYAAWQFYWGKGDYCLSKIIAFCGIDCSECKALIATKNEDKALRKDVAEEWSKMFGHEIKPEEINCVGCLAVDGPHINYCSICEIRKCGIEKRVENCAYCVDYKCEKLVRFHEQSPDAKNRLEEIIKQKSKT